MAPGTHTHTLASDPRDSRPHPGSCTWGQSVQQQPPISSPPATPCPCPAGPHHPPQDSRVGAVGGAELADAVFIRVLPDGHEGGVRLHPAGAAPHALLRVLVVGASHTLVCLLRGGGWGGCKGPRGPGPPPHIPPHPHRSEAGLGAVLGLALGVTGQAPRPVGMFPNGSAGQRDRGVGAVMGSRTPCS